MNEFLLNTINQKKSLFEDFMKKSLDPIKSNSVLYAAIEHSVFSGGKRLRPILLICTFEALSENKEASAALHAACSLELLHSYSLVHDDLPCLDNDLYRRGKKTTHALYGEDIGLLTGDALLTEAFHELTKIQSSDLPCSYVLQLVKILSEKGGLYGMIEGQALECFQSDPESINEATLFTIMNNKTAALFSAAFMMGAVCAQQDQNTVNEFEKVGLHIGKAFQIADDFHDKDNPKDTTNAFRLFPYDSLFSQFNNELKLSKQILQSLHLETNEFFKAIVSWLENQLPENEL